MLVTPLPLIFPPYPLFEAINKFQENGLVIDLNIKENHRIVMSDHLGIIEYQKKKKKSQQAKSPSPKKNGKFP